MKLKKISALCAKSKTYYLFDKRDAEGFITQWLGDGSAFYQLDGLPTVDDDGLCRLFDIPSEQRNKLDITCREMTLDVSDSSPMDLPVESMGMNLMYKGKELIPLQAPGGIMFIQRKYLAPMADEAELIELFERRDMSMRYVVAKAGMFIRAVILPVDLPNKPFVALLGDIYKECRNGTDEADGSIQLSWIEDNDSEGEI